MKNIITKIRIWWLTSELKAVAESAAYHAEQLAIDKRDCEELSLKLLKIKGIKLKPEQQSGSVIYTWGKS